MVLRSSSRTTPSAGRTSARWFSPLRVSPNILPGHRGAHAGRHDAYQGYRPAIGRCLAWVPQPMVRLPGAMAPSRELPAGVRRDARAARCGPLAYRQYARCRHTAGRTQSLCGPGLIGRLGRFRTLFKGTIVGRSGGDHVYGVVTPDDLTGTHQDRSAWDGVFGPVYEKTVSAGTHFSTLTTKPSRSEEHTSEL